MSEAQQKRVTRQSLPEQVAEILRTEIIGHAEPGQRLDTEVNLAKRLGVSVQTLRQAMSVLEHQGLVDRQQGKGTFVTAQATQQFVALAALLSDAIRDSDYQARVFRLLDSVLRERGFQTRHYVKPDYPEAWADLRDDITNGRLSGAAFVAMSPGDLLSALQLKGIPFIGAFQQPPRYVYVDYEAMARDGARHLVERGCRKIALMQIGGDVPASFRTVLAEAGVPIREAWLRHAESAHAPGAGWEEFRELWAARDEKPDGLLVLDDVLFRDVALGILDSHIRVPEQLQVVTHFNKGSGLAYPFPVTLLEVDPREVAEGMGEMLLQLMRKETVPEPLRAIRAHVIAAGVPQPAAPTS